MQPTLVEEIVFQEPQMEFQFAPNREFNKDLWRSFIKKTLRDFELVRDFQMSYQHLRYWGLNMHYLRV